MSNFSIEKIKDIYNSKDSCLELVKPLLGNNEMWDYSRLERTTIKLPTAFTREEAILLGKILTCGFDAKNHFHGPDRIHILDNDADQKSPLGYTVPKAIWMSEWDDTLLEKHSIEIRNIEVKSVNPDKKSASVKLSFCNGAYFVKRECLLEEKEGDYAVVDVGTPGIAADPTVKTDRMLLTPSELRCFTDAVKEYVREQEEEKGL